MPAPYYLCLLSLAACTSPAPPDCPTLVLSIGLVPTGVLFTGSEADVVTGVEYRSCNVDSITAGAMAQVLDPDNQPEPTTVTVRTEPVNAADLDALTPVKMTTGVDAGADADTRLALATVHFTAVTPGIHHLTVQFDPGLGSLQTDLELVVDRRDAGFVTVRMPAPCDDFDLPLGVPLCLTGGQLISVRDGGELASVPANAFAADGVDVWTTSPGDAGPELDLRRLDSSGAFTFVASVPLASVDAGVLPVATPTLYASGERALVVLPPLLFEAWLDGGIALGPAQTTVLSGPFAVSWSPGVGAVVGNDGRNGLSLCTLLFIDGSTHCDRATVVGDDRTAVWTQELGGTLTAWTIEPDGGVVKQTALIGGGIFFGDTVDGSRLSGPLFRGATLGLLLAQLDAGLPVEAYTAPQTLEPPVSLGVSAKRFWECSSGGVLGYVDR